MGLLELQDGRAFIVNQLWRNGKTNYNGVDITLPITPVDSPRGISRYRTMAAFLLDEMGKAVPILNTFPDLQVTLQARTMLNVFSQKVIVDFSYRHSDCNVFLNHQAELTEDIFAHELGHHVNGFFCEQDWADFLGKQKWFIRGREDYQKRVTSPEEMLLLSEDDDPTKPPEIEWILINPVYDKYEGWVKGMERRHGSPYEMVAETFAVNYREILEYTRKFKGTDQQRQRAVIKSLISAMSLF
ncbi:hypothetical protein HYW43_01215 [Candidatus Daviesbacteria bacterium]|nr:hypothetical protein [Candidatus Daviesbacteria bacterium]